MTYIHSKRRRIRAAGESVIPSGAFSAGFTIVEVLLAITLISLLLTAALPLFVVSMQLSVKAQAQIWSSSDASLAVNRILGDTRHAFWVALPGDTKGQFIPPTGTSASAFSVSTGGVTHDTAVEIVFPNSGSAALQNGASNAIGIGVADRTATPIPPIGVLWVYRADSDGTPDATAGSCLWMRGNERGNPIDRALLKSLNPLAPDAVCFDRPAAAASSHLLPYQLRVKIVSAYYSPINGIQTNEASNGTQVTQLTGQCALMRDHEWSMDHEPVSSASSVVLGPWYSN